jgi:hypothetical protein
MTHYVLRPWCIRLSGQFVHPPTTASPPVVNVYRFCLDEKKLFRNTLVNCFLNAHCPGDSWLSPVQPSSAGMEVTG